MKFCGVILASVLLVVGQSLADSCKTCRGADCKGDNIFKLECSKFVPALPFESQLITNDIGEKSFYGCLDLEYYIGDSTEKIQQCVIYNDLVSFCNTLEDVIKIESCSVEPTGQVRSARNVNNPRDALSEDDGEDITTSPTEKPKHDAGAIHLISFTALLTVLVSLFF